MPVRPLGAALVGVVAGLTARIEARHGQQFIDVTRQITSVRSPYIGLTAWFQSW